MTTLTLVLVTWLTLGRKKAHVTAIIALRLLAANARNLLFTAGLAAVSVGLWWERPSLGLIVPGSVVCVGMFAAWWRVAAPRPPRGEG